MLYVLGAVVVGAGVLWKSLGKLLHPLVRKWLSRDVSLGFVNIVSVSRTSLEQAALDQVMKALRASLPVNVTQVYVDRLTLTVGLLRGIRLRASGIHAVVEWVEDDWDSAIDAIEAEVKGKNAKKAQEIISVVQQHLHPKLPVPSCFAGFVESCICAARVRVDGLSLSLRGGNGADIDVTASLHLSTSRCWAIEWRGTQVKADLEVGVKAGGKQLVQPVRLDLTAKLPKVLRTLVAHERLFPERQIPDKLAKKQVKLDVSLKKLIVTATPTALRALMVAGDIFKRFSQWKSNVESECLGVAVSLAPGEQDAYAKALAKGEDVTKWEQRMATDEIVQVYQEWQNWPVPEDKTLDEWLDDLRDEKKVVRSIQAAVKMNNVVLEVLREEALPGDGVKVRLCALRADANLLDPARQRSADAAMPGGPAGPQKAKAEINLGHLEVACEANEDLAMPVLEPCSFQAHCSLHGGRRMSTLHLETRFQKAAGSAVESDVIVATFSSRAVWKLQSVFDELKEKMESQEERVATLKRTGTIAERRRQLHMEEVRKVFRDLDTDPSGTLDKGEVKNLVSRLYGRVMSAKEIEMASEQLFHVLDSDNSGDIGVDEFEQFFEWAGGDAARGMVCLRLDEFVRRLPDEFNAWAAFEASADPELLANPDDARFFPEVVQLQWVRSIQNFQAARRSWREVIGPKLGQRFQDWRISGRTRAVDIWNDATFTLKGLQRNLADQSFSLVVDMRVAGMSLRLADSQHACSIPRVLVDIEDVYLQGGFHKPPGHVIPVFQSVSGQLKLHAQYWNEQVMSAEPFIEPWTLALSAQGSDVSVKAEQHLVVNLTPPFLQAVSVALASLQNLKGEHHSLQEEKFVCVWVVNHTNCDVRVSAQGPVGKGSSVSIPRQDFAKLVPVEIHGTARAATSRLSSSAESWALTLSGEDAVGGSWCIDQGIPFSVTGRQILTAGSRLLAATTSVDVHSLAPIVTLSGITTVKNLTTKSLTLSDGENYSVELKSQQSWHGALGGGLALSLPVIVAGQEQRMSVALPRESVVIEGEVKELDIKHGYRFLLYQRDEPLRNAEAGQEQVVKDRTLLCVPLLNIANTLPCSLTCITGSTNAEEGGSQPIVLAPGEVSGFDDIDPDRSVTLDLEFVGVRYHTVIREHTLKKKKSVMRLQAATRRRRGRNAVSLSRETVDEFCQRTGHEPQDYPNAAPLLDLEFSWENESAVLFVYARYWLANKTGWELEASTGMQRVMTGVVEQVKPSVLQDAQFPTAQRRLSREYTEEDFAHNSPELALLRIPGEKVLLKMRWQPSISDWAWDRRKGGGSLLHWVPELHEETEETGWSQSLSVALTGTAGEVKLPPSDTVGQVTGAASAVLGISVTDLPSPFQRTKLVTVAPRYIVRNDLDEAVQIWPSLGTSRRVPTEPAPDGLPTLQPGVCLSIDAFPPSSRILASPKELVSIRACSSGEGGRWSSQVHLSMVGETTFTVGSGGKGDPHRVVRASVQRIESTIFLVLVKGRWPYSVENHSLTHTVAFHQIYAEDMEEWVLNPCETLNFVFPDPDRPKHLAARICGAGIENCVHYALNDLSATDMLPPLKVFGERRKAALHAELHFRGGHTKVLTLHDEVSTQQEVTATAEAHGRDQVAHGRDQVHSDEGHGGLLKLDIDIFMMGAHVSLIDTRPASPVEMIGLTVDYIQLQKHRMQRSLVFTVHSCQIDDFGQEESLFVFGPAMSGLNSQRSAMADSKNFKAHPFFQVMISGPRNPQNPIFDAEHGMLALNAVELNLQPMEANVDVPRLLSIAMQLKRWLGVIDTSAAGRDTAARSMERSLAPGFRTPPCGGDLVCYVAKLWAEAVSIVVDVKLSKRQSDVGDDEDVQSQLRRISANLWLPLRSFLEFFARMGTSFAEASPHFSFRRLDLHHLTGSVRMVTSSIASEYQSQVVAQVAKSLGSLQVLGDPVNLLDDISSGFNTFLLKTREELQGEREGLGEGVTDLAGGVVGGALGSISKVTGALKDMVGSVTGRPLGSSKRAVDISDGIDLGLMSLASGVSEAVTGLVEDPMEQAEIDGFLGFCRGSLQGGAGFLTRPVEGFLGAMEKFAQGAEHQVRGVNRGYEGLRRPPRVLFAEQTRGLQALQQIFFWPQWTMKVLDVKLPALWKERRVKQLVIFPGQAGRSPDTEVCIVRGSEVDTWALEGRSPQNDAAIGRTGSLRGPFLLQVDANVEGNLEMTNLFRVAVGTARLPVQELVGCLSRPEPAVLTFSIQAQRSPALGEAFTVEQDEVMGEVTVEISRFVNSKILPERFVEQADESSEHASSPLAV